MPKTRNTVSVMTSRFEVSRVNKFTVPHFTLKTEEYTFFLALHGAFSKIDYILNHKKRLNRHKKIEIIPCILLDPQTKARLH